MIRYKFTDKEIDTLIKSIVIIIDSRENKNSHITDHFNKKGIKFINQKLDHGDYSFKIESNDETRQIGVMRDLYFDSYVERKNSVDEICGNLSKDKQQAFINELTRSLGSKFVIFVEDEQFDRNVALGNYRSQYDPKSLRGRLESLQVKYDFEIRPVEKELMGYLIYHRFKYQARHYLKNGTF